jgi:TIR domain/AAA lid domain
VMQHWLQLPRCRLDIADSRFLPDKAIDLVDAAAARLKMQIDSKPEELDAIDREIIRMKRGLQAIKNERGLDARTIEQIKDQEKELLILEERSSALTTQWEAEKEKLASAAKLNDEYDHLCVEAANAQRKGDYQRAGELRYGRIPEILKNLKAIKEAARNGPVTVTPLHIAQVISRETGLSVKQIMDDNTHEQSAKDGQAEYNAPGRIFICYRRDDSAGHAGRVHDRLQGEFGRDLVFMDIDSIPFGVDFVQFLRAAVSKCDVMLAVIGPNWLDAHDDHGNRRLDDPNDFVRIEIAAALQRDISVIPIFLEGSTLRADQLPKDLEGLALRNGLEVRHVSFHSDMDKLIRTLKMQLKLSSSHEQAGTGHRVTA